LRPLGQLVPARAIESSTPTHHCAFDNTTRTEAFACPLPIFGCCSVFEHANFVSCVVLFSQRARPIRNCSFGSLPSSASLISALRHSESLARLEISFYRYENRLVISIAFGSSLMNVNCTFVCWAFDISIYGTTNLRMDKDDGRSPGEATVRLVGFQSFAGLWVVEMKCSNWLSIHSYRACAALRRCRVSSKTFLELLRPAQINHSSGHVSGKTTCATICSQPTWNTGLPCGEVSCVVV